MLKFDLVTIFPEFFEGPLEASLIKKAQEKKLIKINVFNLRDYALDKHRTVDDRPYGGGEGMVFQPEPLFKAVEGILKIKNFSKEKLKKGTRIILTSPRGEKLNAQKSQELAAAKELVILCGHYEGFDERVAQDLATDEISIGDYVLSGGEAAALVILETVARFIPGVVGKENSVAQESFMKGYLDFPVYTRPAEFRGLAVPEELLTGHHKKIYDFRLRQMLEDTLMRRPDLLGEQAFGQKEKQLLEEIISG